MEEKCTLCPNHCLETLLQCEKGKQYFYQRKNISQLEFMQAQDLTSKLMKCGHILMHKTGKKRGQENILDILSQHHSISQKKLQEILGVEAGSLSEILSKLEQRDLIKRYKDEKDKRKSIISLTQKGINKVHHKKSNDEDLFDMLDEKERKQLAATLDKILDEWHQRHMKYQKKEQ